MVETPAHAPIFLAGPTASGKSDVALQLATSLGGEIISVDSMQVYRGLDIGTAKPSPAERQRVRHHLIDILDLHESFDAARFVERARHAVEEIQQRGKVPIFCGGTGLYFKGWLCGLGDAPPSDPELRAQLEQLPLDALLAELEEKDPARFAGIDRQNPRRVVRAVEILRLTGRTATEVRADWKSTGNTPTQWKLVALKRFQDDLNRRILERVDRMFAQGLIEETRLLLEQGLAANPIAMQAIGYRQVVGHLRGERNLADTVELVKRRTTQFARRQLTWLRNQLPCEWLEVPAGEESARTASRICDLLRSPR